MKSTRLTNHVPLTTYRSPMRMGSAGWGHYLFLVLRAAVTWRCAVHATITSFCHTCLSRMGFRRTTILYGISLVFSMPMLVLASDQTHRCLPFRRPWVLAWGIVELQSWQVLRYRNFEIGKNVMKWTRSNTYRYIRVSATHLLSVVSSSVVI